MKNVTIVRYEKTTEEGKMVFLTRYGRIWVGINDNDGFVEVYPSPGDNLAVLAKIIEGIFSPLSNFVEALKEVTEFMGNFRGIVFVFNEVKVTVTKENCDQNQIIAQYDLEYENDSKRREAEYKAWLKTPEGKAYLAEEARKKKAEEENRQKILKVDSETEIQLANPERWEELVKSNTDSYGAGIMKYARLWGKLMQRRMAETGLSVAEVAEQASYDADIMGMSGFGYGCAVQALVECWSHGEELRRWHNAQYGHSGEGVVNPAVLVIREET